MDLASLTPATSVGELAIRHPASTRVLHRRGIDFCCKGTRSLEEVCQSRGMDVQKLLAELRVELSRTDGRPIVWAERSQASLVEHIFVNFHVPEREELRRLDALARKVQKAHGERAPGLFQKLVSTFGALRDELEPHMEREESMLFPWVLSGLPVPQHGPIARMMAEHDECEHLLDQLRELTQNYRVPDEACASWRALWAGLEAFDSDLHEHMHLENNILFPRAHGGA